MEEKWVPVITYMNGIKYDFTGYYEASNLGNVKSLNYNHTGCEKLLVKVVVGDYERVRLSKSGKISNYQVHRIVYEAFNGPIPKGMQVNHINEDKTDNRLENLNLMTPKENINWGTGPCRRSKRMTNRPDQSKSVVQLNLEGTVIKDDWPSTMEVERVLKYNNSKISECCLGKRKTYKGFIWRYKEKGG